MASANIQVGAFGAPHIFLYDGVCSFWSILFAADPPTGSAIIIDALVNGVSIFPNSDLLRIVLQAGQTTEQQGFQFLSNNLAIHQGDILTLNVKQVGSINPGSNGVVRVVAVR